MNFAPTGDGTEKDYGKPICILFLMFFIIYSGWYFGTNIDYEYKIHQRYLSECSNVTDQNFNEFCLNYDVSQRTTR